MLMKQNVNNDVTKDSPITCIRTTQTINNHLKRATLRFVVLLIVLCGISPSYNTVKISEQKQ